MGQTEATRSELHAITEVLDFLYIDTDRVNSIISQVNCGLLKEVNITISGSSGASKTHEQSIQYIIGGKTGSSDRQDSTHSSQRSSIPYHHSIIQLLQTLRIPISCELQKSEKGRLVVLQGNLSIYSSDAFNVLMSSLSSEKDSAKLFKQNPQTFKQIKMMINTWLKSLNGAVSLKLICKNGTVTTVIKEQYLQIRSSDLNLMYGKTLPGEWCIFGILDYNNNTSEISPNISTIEEAIEALNLVMKSVSHDQFKEYSIIPILIFRSVTVDSL